MFRAEQLIDVEIDTESISNENTTKSFFEDNSDLLEKGSLRHSITEIDGKEIPYTVIKREYSSFDETLNWEETITIATSVFNSRKKSIVRKINLEGRIAQLKSEIRKYSDRKEYEICARITTELRKIEAHLKRKNE